MNKSNKTKYVIKLQVKSAPSVDRERLIVRINKEDKPENISWYDYIWIKNHTSNKQIACKLHGDNIPEVREKNKGNIMVNEPLRVELGVKLGDIIEFELDKANKFQIWYYFIRFHPDDSVKVGTWLGIIAIVISIISIIISIGLGILSIRP